MKRIVWFVVVLVGCDGGAANKPAWEVGRAACAVIEPICAVASSACSFVPETSGGEAPDEP